MSVRVAYFTCGGKVGGVGSHPRRRATSSKPVVLLVHPQLGVRGVVVQRGLLEIVPGVEPIQQDARHAGLAVANGELHQGAQV